MLPRILIALVLSSMLSAPVASQQRRVVVSRPDDRQLRLIALRHHLCEERVQQARQALQRADELAPRLSARSLGQLGQLGRYWSMLFPDRAEAEIEEIVDQLRRRAAASTDAGEYQQSFYAAQQLVSSLQDGGGVERLEGLVASWPEGPVPSEGWLDNARRQFERNRHNRIANRDPLEALDRLGELESESADWNLRNHIFNRLLSLGELEAATALADETLTLLNEAPFEQPNIHAISSMVTQMATLDPHRFDAAIDVFFQQLGQLDQRHPGMVSRSGPNGRIELSQGQAQILNMLRGLGNRPRTVLRVLDRAPELAAILDAAGGIDNFLAGNHYSRRLAADPVQRLQAELSGADADTVIARLGTSADPREISMLAGAVQRHCGQPEEVERLQSIALRQLRQVEAFQASGVMMQLIQTSARCLGEIPAELESEARLLIEDLRDVEEEGRRRPIQGRTRYFGPTGQLEVELAAAEARFHFDDVVLRISRLEETDLRFAAWMKTLQILVSR